MATASPRTVLREAILAAYDAGSLEQLLLEGVPSRDFTDLVPTKAAFDRQAFELIDRAIDEGWLGQFVDDALRDNKDNVLFVAAVRPIADKIKAEGLASAMGPKESLDGCTPELSKGTEKLLTAANEASGLARSAWFAFLVLLVLLLITLYGVTHKDLLLNSQVNLPIVGGAIPVPLTSFFQFAPALLLVAYLSLLIQHVILAQKYRKFTEAIAPYENTALKQHPAREQVHSYFMSQILAGAPTNAITNWIMRVMVFVSFALLPIATLMYFQIKFLPFHDIPITYWHRIAILMGLAMLFAFLPLICLKTRKREVRIGSQEAWRASPYGMLLGAALATLVVSFSWLIATMPDEALDRWIGFRPMNPIYFYEKEKLLNPIVRFAYEWIAPTDEEGIPERVKSERSLLPWLIKFRVLVVEEETNLVPDEGDKRDEPSLVLRGRNLQFARLWRSDLHRADLTGADLSGADLSETRLEKGKLRGAILPGADLAEVKLQGADLELAKLQRADLREAKLQDADLGRAKLQGADLKFAKLQGVDLALAELQGADLRGADLQGAVTNGDFTGADLRGADLRGADLSGSDLEVADLREAKLQGADLASADLRGADLRGAKLQGADVSAAWVWLASFPIDLTDQSPRPLGVAELRVSPPSEDYKAVSREKLQASLTEGELLEVLFERLDPIVRADPPTWEDEERWSRYIAETKEPSTDEIVQFLAGMACENPEGYVAMGIARRASHCSWGRRPLKSLAEAILDENCKGAKRLSDRWRATLENIAFGDASSCPN